MMEKNRLYFLYNSGQMKPFNSSTSFVLELPIPAKIIKRFPQLANFFLA